MTTQRVFVGNLPFASKTEDVRQLFSLYGFSPYGEVLACSLIVDSGSRPGYSFVDMEAEDATKAIAALNGTTFGGRPLQVHAQSD